MEGALPTGVIVGTCILKDCREIKSGPLLIDETERLFGHYAAGRYMWILENPVRYSIRPKVKGSLGIWEWKDVSGV